MQSVQFERIPQRAPRKPGERNWETIRRVNRERTTAEKLRREARLIMARLKNRI